MRNQNSSLFMVNVYVLVLVMFFFSAGAWAWGAVDARERVHLRFCLYLNLLLVRSDMTELGQALVTCTWRWQAKLRGEMWRMRSGKRKWAFFFFWCGLDRISRDKWVTVAGRREKGIAQCRFQSRQKDKPGENDKYHEQKREWHRNTFY